MERMTGNMDGTLAEEVAQPPNPAVNEGELHQSANRSWKNECKWMHAKRTFLVGAMLLLCVALGVTLSTANSSKKQDTTEDNVVLLDRQQQLWAPRARLTPLRKADNDRLSLGLLENRERALQPNSERTAAEVIQQTYVLTYVQSALVSTGLDDLLSTSGPFILIVAWDYGWQRMPYHDKFMAPDWRGHLRHIMEHGIHQGYVPEDTLPESTTMTMMSGETLELTHDGRKVEIQGRCVIAVTELSNGFACMVEDVIEPAFLSLSVYDLVASDYTTFASYLEANSLHTILQDTAENVGYTVFAPLNNAFASYDGDITSDLVKHHISASVVHSINIAEDANFATVQGSDLTVRIDTQGVMKVTGQNTATVTTMDRLGYNGVVHGIDTVLRLEASRNVQQEVIELVGPSLIASSPDAFYSSLDWFTRDNFIYMDENDSLQGSSLNMQRFALAWLWYHTTLNGQEPWLSCNPPDEADGEDENCQLLTVSVVDLIDDEVVMCYAGLPSTRWLSATHECQWPGVNCDETGTVAYEVDLLAVGLHGTFPSFLQLMPGIETIQLSYGAISGKFPQNMEGFNGITQLVLIGNLMEGPIPDSFFNMPLWNLNLAYNKFKGRIPKSIGNFSDIGSLYLMENEFEGPLPESLGQVDSLSFLRLENNALTGSTLPASWGNLNNLQFLYMNGNGLRGIIPQEWSNMESMENFRLYDNELEGPLPNMQSWVNLERIFLYGNSFNGTFPEEFYSSRVLQFIQFAENEFSGPLEDRFDGMNNLIAMALDDNRFTGTIPPSMEGLDSIRILRLQNNLFTGEVPTSLCDIRGPSSLSLLEADCGGNPIANECTCCTTCCNRETRVCEVVTGRRRLSMVDAAAEDEQEAVFHRLHDDLLPRKRRLQASDCTARYRWDRNTGRLVEYVEN